MARPTPETTTLVFAVTVAVALGVACGVWVNAKLTAAASKNLQTPARLAPAATPEPTTPDGVSPSADADSQRQAADGDSHQAAPENGGETPANGSDAPSESQAESQTQGPSSAADDVRKERPTTGVVVSATREARPSESREASPSEKPRATRDEAREVDDAPRARAKAGGAAAPCAPYASAGSLSLRVGGASALVVGGPGAAGRVTLTTPDWADIAVFSEGRAGGNGWVKYSVRSISGRPGVYTLHLRTPCGSQTIPVTVARP
ncbi:MAG TPA: hypothetical protein VNZ44_19865 [Pyrinomonadaceae bacterium]|nr:hypothetical protein [Pyrinomonadaceae bacterium]